uniref:Uncharacterized protein n=1 Tax=Trichogramma kaykai TaxID=54128 RepID=A0ABD2XPW5_9HYME
MILLQEGHQAGGPTNSIKDLVVVSRAFTLSFPLSLALDALLRESAPTTSPRADSAVLERAELVDLRPDELASRRDTRDRGGVVRSSIKSKIEYKIGLNTLPWGSPLLIDRICPRLVSKWSTFLVYVRL